MVKKLSRADKDRMKSRIDLEYDEKRLELHFRALGAKALGHDANYDKYINASEALEEEVAGKKLEIEEM